MSSYFPEKKYEWKIIEILDFPFQLPLSGEGFTFFFLSKSLLTNQIAGFEKVQDFIKC